jgi:DNA-binding response OmpR family regulator
MRVLLVEDDPGLAAGMRIALGSAGYATDIAAACRDAESLWHVNPYDAVLLDLQLPDGDGRKLLRMMRDGDAAPPVMVVSARSALDDRVQALDSGADDFLTKPFEPEELIARLRALLRRPRSWTPPSLVVGNLTLDRARNKATAGDEPLPLTIKEWTVLHFLAVHVDTLVTRTALLDHCWDDRYEGISNLVDVHIARLRRKLKDAHATCSIETVRNAGFILKAE